MKIHFLIQKEYYFLTNSFKVYYVYIAKERIKPMKKITMFLLVLMLITLIGCNKVTPEVASINTITAKEAKEMMDSEMDVIILDVRTPQEYSDGHIEDAILLPDYEVKDKVNQIISDKEATILVYCRSGRRSAAAAQTLQKLGYASIYDFGGVKHKVT